MSPVTVFIFLLTFKEVWHLVRKNRAGLPELWVSGVRVKGQLSNFLDVRPLGIYGGRVLCCV